MNCLLEGGIAGPQLVICSEHVTESQVVSPLRVINSHDVEVMRSDVWLAFFDEQIPTVSTAITTIEVAKSAQAPSALVQVCRRSKGHGDVDDRLGIQTQN